MGICRYCCGVGRIPYGNGQEYICPDCRGTGTELELDLQGRVYTDEDCVTKKETTDGQN